MCPIWKVFFFLSFYFDSQALLYILLSFHYFSGKNNNKKQHKRERKYIWIYIHILTLLTLTYVLTEYTKIDVILSVPIVI